MIWHCKSRRCYATDEKIRKFLESCKEYPQLLSLESRVSKIFLTCKEVRMVIEGRSKKFIKRAAKFYYNAI